MYDLFCTILALVGLVYSFFTIPISNLIVALCASLLIFYELCDYAKDVKEGQQHSLGNFYFSFIVGAVVSVAFRLSVWQCLVCAKFIETVVRLALVFFTKQSALKAKADKRKAKRVSSAILCIACIVSLIVALYTNRLSFKKERIDQNSEESSYSVSPDIEPVYPAPETKTEYPYLPFLFPEIENQFDYESPDSPFPDSPFPDSPSPDSKPPGYSYDEPSTDYDISDIVYVTGTGKKYHKGWCSYLRSSKISITYEEAIKKGYKACSRCGG